MKEAGNGRQAERRGFPEGILCIRSKVEDARRRWRLRIGVPGQIGQERRAVGRQTVNDST